jgi:hypothetical protein
MNGLINIYADNIEATNSTVNDTLIVDGKDINTVANQVDTNNRYYIYSNTSTYYKYFK